MNHEGFQGASFGVMDAIITVLGVMIGLSITTGEKNIIIIGILTAGIADAFANAAGMHVAQETETHHTQQEVWKSTIFCFIATAVTTLVLSAPIILLSHNHGLYASIAVGLLLLIGLGYFVSKVNTRFNPVKLAVEYVIIGITVSGICYVIGTCINLV